MKKQLLFLIFSLSILSINKLYSQCNINTYIENNYSFDAKILALREILSDEQDPDYDEVEIPLNRYQPYLEKLSAIYDNQNSEPVLDSLFNEFQFHVNLFDISRNVISLGIDHEVTWLQDFIDTGISGIATIDNITDVYSFSVSGVIYLTNLTIVFIESTHEVLNLLPLAEEIGTVTDVLISEPYAVDDFLNYSGIPYTIPGLYDSFEHGVEMVDIYMDGDLFYFWMGAEDCMAGCMTSKTYTVEVDENCSVTLLSTSEFDSTGVTLYPNPAEDYIHIEGLQQAAENISVYTLSGKALPSVMENNKIDVSNLAMGVYIVSITTYEGQKTFRKFIKR